MHAKSKWPNDQQPGSSSQVCSTSKQLLCSLEKGVRRSDDELSQSGHSEQENLQPSYNNSLNRGVRSSLHGIVYQLKISMLFLHTALQKEYKFKLYSEKEDAEKFDDVILNYGRDGQYRFLQAKHTLNPEKDKITIGKLLSKDSKEPFSLQKYFISFRRIKQNQEYKEKIKDITICTNADFSDDIKKEVGGMLTNKDECDDILDIGGGKRYEFIFNKNEDIVKRLKDASDLNRLARELAKVVFGKGKSLNLKNELFKAYRDPLLEEVLLFYTQEGKEKKSYCELRKNFKEKINLSKEAKLLRKAFEKEALKIVKNIDNLWSIVSEKKINASSTFGKYTKPVSDKVKLPNDPVEDDEIEEFFKKLIFAVEQPNEVKLGILIQDKIFNSLDHLEDYVQAEMIYNYVQKQMLDWLKKSESTALLKKDDFFNEGAKKVNNIMLSIPNKVYISYIKKKGIKFNIESKELQKLKRFLSSKDNKIFNFVSSEENIFLSQAKVYQVKQQEAWQLRTLLNLKKFGDNKAENLFKDNLLVIVCKNESQTENEDIKELYNELANSIKDSEKKVVLITQGYSILANFFETRSLKDNYEKNPDTTRVRDLHPDYLQNKLLKKMIIFQGQKENLLNLIGIKDKKSKDNGLSLEDIHKLEEIVKCETLCEVMSDEGIVVGDKLLDIEDSSSPYYDPYHIDIPRKFDAQIMSKDSLKECIEEKKKDIFAFSSIKKDYLQDLVSQKKGEIKAFSERGSSDNNFCDGRFFVLDANNPEKDFKELANKNSGKDVHWITNIDNKFILKHSSRLSGLRKFIIKDSGKKIKDLTNSVIIIAGDPGIGKSTVLTMCSKKLDSSSWFIRVNLKDHQINIENANFRDLKGTMEFFSKSTTGLETALAKSLLEYRLKYQGQVVLLLDGYDEIKDRHQEKVIRLLKIFKDTKGKVWLTTRLNKQCEVENALGMFSYSLNPFCEEEQKFFLKQFWIKKLVAKEQNSQKGRIHNFAEELLKHFQGLGLMKEGDLVGIVLQARMVAGIFQDECKKYLKSEKFNPSEFRIKNIFDLYERFVEYQYERYFTEKRKFSKELLGKGSQIVLTESYTKAHGCLALKTLFSEDQTCEELKDKIHQVFLPDELSGMGLIKNSKDTDIVDFVHRTYAEYFMAKLLVRMLGKREYDLKYKLVREFLLRNIFFDCNKLIRVFCEHGIQKINNDYLNIKWKEIQDCDLLREIKTKGSLQLCPVEDSDARLEVQQNSAMPEKSLNELKEEVEGKMEWNASGRYCYYFDTESINKLFQKFLKTTNIEDLESTLKFLVNADRKSEYERANNEFLKNNNIYNAVKHYSTQAKLQNKLDCKFRRDMVRQVIPDFKIFEQKFAKQKSSTPKNYKEELNSFLFSQRAGELDLLSMEFPFVVNKQNIESHYISIGSEENSYKRLEREGVQVAKGLKILTPEMSTQFCSVLIKPMGGITSGVQDLYAYIILDELIYPIIDMMKEEKLPNVKELDFIKMLACFTYFSIEPKKSLSFKSSQLEIVLKQIDTLLSKQEFENVLESANYLFILGEVGLKLIDTGQEILMLDPASEFQYTLSNSRDQLVKLINWKCKNPQNNFFKKDLEEMSKPQMRKRSSFYDRSGDQQALTKKRKKCN